VKETQEGCLSRSIDDFFERLLFKKVALSVSKRLFQHAEIPGALHRGLLSCTQNWFTQLAMSTWGTNHAPINTRKLATVSEPKAAMEVR